MKTGKPLNVLYLQKSGVILVGWYIISTFNTAACIVSLDLD